MRQIDGPSLAAFRAIILLQHEQCGSQCPIAVPRGRRHIGKAPVWGRDAAFAEDGSSPGASAVLAGRRDRLGLAEKRGRVSPSELGKGGGLDAECLVGVEIHR